MRRTDAGTELHDHVRGIRPEPINHLPDRVRNDAELGAFAPGMHQTDRRCFRIDDVKSAAVGDVNAERDAALIGDDAIAAGELVAPESAEDSGRYSAFSRVSGRLSFYKGEREGE